MPCISIVTYVALALLFPILTEERREKQEFVIISLSLTTPVYARYHASIYTYHCSVQPPPPPPPAPNVRARPRTYTRARKRCLSPFLNSFLTHTTLKILYGLRETACKYIVIE